MDYGIRELSQLAGVSARTLRYYDQIGLLKPLYISDSGYRHYGEKEVERLQQILFYRERGLKLLQIKEMLCNPHFDAMAALQEHLEALRERQEHTQRLIAAVQKTIALMKGELIMNDMERFAAFKKELVEENEKKYGQEIREKYGEKTIDAANRRMLDMTQEEYEQFQSLEQEILSSLQEAIKNGEKPEGETGKKIALLHKDWISRTWKEYSAQAHKGLVDMYTADPRFTKYYDKETPGCAEFLNRAVKHWI